MRVKKRGPGRWIRLMLLGGMTVAASSCAQRSSSDAASLDGASQVDLTVAIDNMGVPARYSASLPSTFADLQSWHEDPPKFPPKQHVIEGLLFGDPAVFAKLEAAAKAVPVADSDRWSQLIDGMLEFHTVDDAFCRQGTKVMEGKASTLRNAIAGVFASECAESSDLALIVRSDTPDWAVVKYYDATTGLGVYKTRPFHPRLADAARKAIVADDYRARKAAFVLAQQSDPRGGGSATTHSFGHCRS